MFSPRSAAKAVGASFQLYIPFFPVQRRIGRAFILWLLLSLLFCSLSFHPYSFARHYYSRIRGDRPRSFGKGKQMALTLAVLPPRARLLVKGGVPVPNDNTFFQLFCPLRPKRGTQSTFFFWFADPFSPALSSPYQTGHGQVLPLFSSVLVNLCLSRYPFPEPPSSKLANEISILLESSFVLFKG